jgi:hypothetical protein
MDDLPPGYSQSDVVGNDLPPGYKSSDVVTPSKPKAKSNVISGLGQPNLKEIPAPRPAPSYNPTQGGRPFSLGGRGSEMQEQPEVMQVGPLKQVYSRAGTSTNIPGKLRGGTDIETRAAMMPGAKGVATRALLGTAKTLGFGSQPTPEDIAMKIGAPLFGALGPLASTALGEAFQAPETINAIRNKDWEAAAASLGIGGVPGIMHGTGKAIGGAASKLAAKNALPKQAEILQNFPQTPTEVSDVPALTRRRLPGTYGEQPKLLPPPGENAFVVDPQGNITRANIGNLQNPDVLGRPNAIEKPLTRPLTRSQMPKPPTPQTPAETAQPAPTETPRTQGEAALGATHPNPREVLDVHPLTGQEFKTSKEMQDAADTMNTLFPGSNAAVETIGRRKTLTIDSGWEAKSGQQKPTIPKPAPVAQPTVETAVKAPETPAEPSKPEEVTYDTLEDVERKRAGNIREKIQTKLDQELPAAAMPDEHGQVLDAENKLGAETAARVDKVNKAAIVLSRSGSTWADKIKARQVMNEMTGIDPSINSPRFGRMKGESEANFAHRIRRDFADTEWNSLHDNMMAKIEELKGGPNAVQKQAAGEGVLRQEGPTVELQGMGEGNTKPESPPEKGFTIKNNPRRGSFDASIAEDVARAVQHGAELIGKKIVTFAKWAPEMIKEFGETVRPHLVRLWDQSHDAFKAGATKKPEEPLSPEAKARAERLGNFTGGPQKKPTLSENIGNAIKGAWLAPSSWQTLGTPFHGVLRHGLPLTLNHPVMAAQSIAQTAKAFASREGFAQVRDYIDNLPTKAMADHFGVGDTGQHIANPTKGEEEFIGNTFLQKIPGGGPVIGALKNAMNANHRGFLTYLDLMAQKGFAKKAAELEKWGINPANNEAAYKGLAGLINNERGRGSLGPMENHAALAAAVMYSPRLQASRVALLNPVYYAKLPAGARRIAVTDAAKGISIAVGAIMAAKAAGAEVPTDPRDSNFLKMKIAGRWVDALGGFRSYIPLIVQSVTGEKVVNGQLKNNVGFGESRGSVAAKLVQQEFRKKASPSFGMAYNLSPLSKNKEGINVDAVGNPVTLKGELSNVAAPFFAKDLVDYYRDTDTGSLLIGELAAQLGSTSYEPSVRALKLKGVGLNLNSQLPNMKSPF